MTISSNNLPQVVGWRTSDYGIQDPTAVIQSNSTYYIEAAKGMAIKFPGSKPGGIYTVGYIDNMGTQPILNQVNQRALEYLIPGDVP